MQVLSLHFKGKMAHFRKYYSNSSALSYFIPPRTTIIGIIAGILGYKRDTYYDDFSLKNCSISLACCNPLKKITQTMNYLMIKSKNDFNGSQQNHSQTSMEFVIPEDIKNGCIDYEIFICHRNDSIMQKLKNVCSKDLPVYNSCGIGVALGTAFNLGWIEYGGLFEGIEKSNAEVTTNSIMGIDSIEKILLKKERADNFLIKERIPIEFDNERKITPNGLKDFVIDLKGNPVNVVSRKYVSLCDGRDIMWME
jgi:CRISPR-associated protein Cas5h